VTEKVSQQKGSSDFSNPEIDVDLLTTDELVLNPHLLDGFKPCEACDRLFVLCERRYCSNCARMLKEYEGRQRPQPVAQTDMGVVPFEPDYDPGTPASRFAVWLVFFAAVCSVMFLLTGMWYTGRVLIGICLEHSR